MQFVSLIERNLDPDHQEQIKFLVNVEAIHKNFKNIPYFNTKLRYQGPSLMIVGGRSNQYPFQVYRKVFTNIIEEAIVVVPGAGHWVHFDKPSETIKLVSNFLDEIDEEEDSEN